MAEPAAVAYLGQSAHSFWRWEDKAQVTSWTTGGVIAFRPEIEAVVRALAGEGLPPLESILLFLAACRPGWSQGDRGLLAGLTQFHEARLPVAGLSWRLVQQVRGRSPAALSLLERMQKSEHPLTVLLEAVLAGLDAVAALPQEYRSKLDSKAALARLVFEPVKVRQTPAESEQVLAGLKAGLTPELLEVAREEGDATRRFADSLAALVQGLSAAPLSREQVEVRLRTGLDELPKPPPAEAPAATSVRDLLRLLEQDQELASLSKLARDLMAVVYLPRRVSDHEELPVGGFSDITNRGPLDRLLPGELAHDDLTLTVRIALNEAMYFRRETPPRNPTGRRRLLIDAGIRMWGLPRAFGAAVALAMAATGESRAEVSAFRAAGKKSEPVDLKTREGLVGLLESLEIDAHPAGGLEAFLSADGEAGEDEQADNILITHPDVLDDADFRQAALALCDRPLYVAAVERDGAFRLERWSRVGRTVLRQAKLDLAGLFSHRPAKPPLLDESYDPSLPVILSTRPFPLLLQHSVDPKKIAFRSDTDMLAVSSDRRLMLWTKRSRGALQLTDSLPRGTICWMGFLLDQACVVVRTSQGLRLVKAELDGTGATSRPLLGDAIPQGACLLGERLCLIYPRMIWVVSLVTGETIQTFNYDGQFKWQQGRVFRQGYQWHVLAPTPTGAAFQQLALSPSSAADTLAVFERDGMDGLWAVFGTGEVVQLTGDGEARQAVVAAGQYGRAKISTDGHRLALEPIGGRDHLHIDLKAGRKHVMNYAEPVGLHWQFVSDSTGGLRRKLSKFSGFGVAEHSKSLCLHPRLGATVARLISLIEAKHGKTTDIAISPQSGQETVRRVADFASVPQWRDAGYLLKVAITTDGSKVWLDSRGLVHLVSSDQSLPQITLVLVNEGRTAGWASDGTCCGPEYFVGDHATVDAQTFYRHIERFIERLG